MESAPRSRRKQRVAARGSPSPASSRTSSRRWPHRSARDTSTASATSPTRLRAGGGRGDRRRVRRHRHGSRQRRHRHLRLGRDDTARGLRRDHRHQRQRRPPDRPRDAAVSAREPRLGRDPRLDRLVRPARRARRPTTPRRPGSSSTTGRCGPRSAGAASARRRSTLVDRHRPRPRGRIGPGQLRRDAEPAALAGEGDDLGRGLREGDRRRGGGAQGQDLHPARGAARLLGAEPAQQQHRRASAGARRAAS